MSKAVLVMDMPRACFECPFMYKADELLLSDFKYQILHRCLVQPEDVEEVYLEDIMKKRQDWCTLKQSEWVKCDDRLPEDMKYVLVTTDDGVVTEAFYSERKKMFIKSAGHTLKVKAWMDKPEPYREDECGKRVK